MLARLLNIYLLLFLADTGLSLADEAGSLATGAHPLAWPRDFVATLVMLASLPLYALMLLTPRVPRLIFLPLALFPLLAVLLVVPLACWQEWSGYGSLQITLAQAAVAGFSLWLLWRRTGGRLLFRHEDLHGPFWAWRSSLGLAAGSFFLLLPLSLGAFLGLLERCIDCATGGFVDVRFYGLELVERVYERHDRRVRLVGMMHVGDESAYRALAESFDGDGVVVLVEGVTDRGGLLGRGRGYKRVAEKLGLDAQRDLRSYHPSLELRHADVDVSDFAPSTVEMLRLSGALFDERGFSPAGLLEIVQANADFSEADEERFWVDVVDARNDVLAGHLRRAIEEYSVVVVPWGAAHLPGIQDEVLAMGFGVVEERHHSLFSWVD